MKNKWDLAENIPEPTKRKVRQRCGFGCVVCGNAFYQYHHSTTKFNEAQEHNADEIVLLCYQHHGQVTNHLASDEAVSEAAQNPKCLQLGYSSFKSFDESRNNIEVIAGTLKAINTKTLIQVFGQPIFCIDYPEYENAPFRVSAIFCDKVGNKSLIIEENELKVFTKNWDAEFVGTTVTIRRAPRDIVLKLRIEARKPIVIEELNMLYEGVKIICKEGKQTSIEMPDGRYFQTTSGTIENCDVGIDVTKNGLQLINNCEKAYFESMKIGKR